MCLGLQPKCFEAMLKQPFKIGQYRHPILQKGSERRLLRDDGVLAAADLVAEGRFHSS